MNSNIKNVRQKLIDLNNKNNELTIKSIKGTLTREDVVEALEYDFNLDYDFSVAQNCLDYEYVRDIDKEKQVLYRFAKKYGVK